MTICDGCPFLLKGECRVACDSMEHCEYRSQDFVSVEVARPKMERLMLDTICNEYKAGLSMNRISKKYKIGSATVRKSIVRMGIPIKPPVADNGGKTARKSAIPDEIKEKILSLYNDGMGMVKIAKALHIRESRVKDILVNANVELRCVVKRKPNTKVGQNYPTNFEILDAHQDEFLDMYTSGLYKCKEIADHFGVNKSMLSKWITKNNLRDLEGSAVKPEIKEEQAEERVVDDLGIEEPEFDGVDTCMRPVPINKDFVPVDYTQTQKEFDEFENEEDMDELEMEPEKETDIDDPPIVKKAGGPLTTFYILGALKKPIPDCHPAEFEDALAWGLDVSSIKELADYSKEYGGFVICGNVIAMLND